MKILVTGAHGQLGTDIMQILSSEHEIYGFARQELNITDQQTTFEIIQQIKPDAVIHAAAYTKVDQAESDPELSYSVNAYGTRNVVLASQKIAAKVIYISTDYVFAGTRSVPYCEFDQTSPVNVYGRSKLAGEEMVKTFSDKFFIVRTSWLYGRYGTNFVSTILQLSEQQEELRIVSDQVGSPTYTVDLVRFLRELLRTEQFGIYHATNTGSCSWFEFAKTILETVNRNRNIVPVRTEDFPRPAARPAFSVLDHMAIRQNSFNEFRHWRAALQDFLFTSS